MKVLLMGALAKERYFPADLTDTEVWGLNAYYPAFVPRWDRRFNLHTYVNLERYKWKGFEKECRFSHENPNVPFLTLDRWPDRHKLDGWRVFPVLQMMNGMERGSYHCSSFDWMVAYAIWLNEMTGPEMIHEIVLHGTQLNMEAGEPISARACLEYWCGRAEGAGIKVSLAGDAKLFDFYHLVRSKLIYGVDDTPVVQEMTRGEVEVSLLNRPAPYDYED